MKIGMTGSVAHVMTNDKIQDKGACLKELIKEPIKDMVTIATTGAVAGGAAAGSVVALNKLSSSKNEVLAGKSTALLNSAKNLYKNVKTSIGNTLGNVSIDGQNLKDAVKNSKIYTKFNGLPAPAKAAIALGTAALAVVAPLVTINNASKAGYIEGKHEA